MTLTEFLRGQRLTLQLKCDGLDAGQLARRAVEPSTMSLLGLVRHMAEVERAWFRRRFAGHDVPRRYQTGADPDGDFNGAVADPAVAAEAWAAWREEIAFAEQFTRGHDLGFAGSTPKVSRSRCASCWCTWSRSTPATTGTPTCSASASTGASASSTRGGAPGERRRERVRAAGARQR